MFVTNLKAMPHTTHIGLPSNASTLYGDIRRIQLPSGIGNFIIPQKVFFYANRAPEQPITPEVLLRYDPEAELEGKDSLRAAVEKWIGFSD